VPPHRYAGQESRRQRQGSEDSLRSHRFSKVRRTLRISCEAVPPPVSPAGAQGGTLSCRSGAALSFVSCIRLLGRSHFRPRSVIASPSVWADRAGTLSVKAIARFAVRS
jgi:hypothetical protein